MKLHLGCGQRYLTGYLNIDFPSSEHSVQEKSVADQHANLLDLRYPAGSIAEVRLHHVFEHFPRPAACALLAAWHSWQTPGGVLHIEVPDFARTARRMLNPLLPFAKRAVAERHLFGSHEAPWAVHCEGYTPSMLRHMAECFGFTQHRISRNSWKGTHNFELIARKGDQGCSRDDFHNRAAAYLGAFLVDSSEQKLLDVWLEMYRTQLERSWACNE